MWLRACVDKNIYKHTYICMYAPIYIDSNIYICWIMGGLNALVAGKSWGLLSNAAIKHQQVNPSKQTKEEQKTVLDCDLWRKNQTPTRTITKFMSRKYRIGNANFCHLYSFSLSPPRHK